MMLREGKKDICMGWDLGREGTFIAHTRVHTTHHTPLSSCPCQFVHCAMMGRISRSEILRKISFMSFYTSFVKVCKRFAILCAGAVGTTLRKWRHTVNNVCIAMLFIVHWCLMKNDYTLLQKCLNVNSLMWNALCFQGRGQSCPRSFQFTR